VLLLTAIIHWMLTRHAAPHSLFVRLGRPDALMDFIQPVMNDRLSFGALAVHPNNQVVCRFGAMKVGVMAVTE
jgi:hypothetical protein